MKVVKTDGYNELFNGGGANSPKPFYMVDAHYGVSTFYEENSTAKRIVDVVPEEMVTAGFKLSGVKDEQDFKSRWDELKLDPKIIDCLCWSRLHGGAAIVILVKDNRKLTSQVREGAELESIRVYDRFQIRIEKRETNARSSRYGEPLIYKVSPGEGMEPYEIHHSRVFISDGERLTPGSRRRNEGWGASVLNKSLIEAISDYDYCETIATQILRRKQQAVWKVKGLAEMCDDDDAQYAARIRLAQVDDNSGVGKAIGIDAETEEYDVLNSDISGVPDFLASKMDRVVSLSGIHEIIIKNKNVAGMSKSQNTALETFYKLIDRKREEDYRPLLEFLLPFVVHEKEWSIEFDPLSVPSKHEESEITKNNVESIRGAFEDQLIDREEARDTLRSIVPAFKMKDTDNIKLEQPEQTEPEPGTGDKLSDES